MALGRKTGGRARGTPNKVSSAKRAAFLATFENLAPELEGWLRTGAAESPLKAADILVRMAEYHLPKLARNEMTGTDGEPIQIVVRKYTRDE